MNPKEVEGIAISSDLDGKLINIIYDGLRLGKRIKLGSSFIDFLDEGSKEKGSNFLNFIKKEKFALDWELNLLFDSHIMVLHFFGFIDEQKLLIFGTKSMTEIGKFLETVLTPNNLKSTLLQNLITGLDHYFKNQESKDIELYDEIGHLNNELTTAQRELTKKNIQLELLNEQKNQFLGMAAHDLRNPLSVIQMYSEFVIDEAGEVLGEEHLEFLQVIQSSSEFMLNIINDLLDVSKIESGKLNLELQPTLLGELIEDNIKLNQVLANKKNIKINFNYSGDTTSPIMIDRSKIDQVMNNLISNAIKFSNPKADIYVDMRIFKDKVMVSVKDEGLGIPAHEVSKLFKPFSKTSVQGTAGEKSTGLGLSITKRIIEAHDGTISVKSIYGKGSTFTFLLLKPTT